MRGIALAVTLLLACRGGDPKREQPRREETLAKDATVATRPAPNGVDVPALSALEGTTASNGGPVIALTRQRISIEGVGDYSPDPSAPDFKKALREHRLPSRFAIAVDRTLTVATLLPLLDQLHELGAGRIELLVTVGLELRAVTIEFAHALAGDEPITNLKAFAPVPEMTIQTLAEVIAIGGGSVTLGSGNQPRVEPVP